MSNGAQIDYDALAKQAGAISSTPPPVASPGGAVDYDALAKQAGAISSTPPPTPTVIPGTNVPNDYLSKAEDLIGGFTSGAAQNIPFIGKYFKPTPQAQATVVNPDYSKAGEIGGRAYEQGLEIAAGSGALKATAGRALAESLPWLQRLAPLGRIGAESAAAGTSAAAHGQPIGPAAAIGAGGAAASEGLSALAPGVAEKALRIRDVMRGYGKTIGERILGEVPSAGEAIPIVPGSASNLGITPSTIANRAEQQIADLTGQMEGRVNSATTAGTLGSSQPAHDALDAIIANTPRNSTEALDKLEQLRTKIGFPFDPANPQTTYTPSDLLEMKRGIGESIKNWPPEWQRSPRILNAEKQIYGALDAEVDRLAPGTGPINQRISSLIPASRQALRVAQGEDLIPRTLGRVAAQTGALTAAAAGLGYGRAGKEGLGPGAILGGLTGLVGPEIVASPAAQMAMARLMQLGIPTAIARGIVASRQPETAQAPAPGSAGQFQRGMQAPAPSGTKASQFGTPF